LERVVKIVLIAAAPPQRAAPTALPQAFDVQQ